jgi:hypothetical protein
MRLLVALSVLSATAAVAEEPILSAPFCAARHQKLVAVDREAISVLDAWNAYRRSARGGDVAAYRRKTAEGAAAVARLLESGEQAGRDAARCTAAGFRSTPAQRVAYRRNEKDFHRVEPILAALQEAYARMRDAEQGTRMAGVKQ